MPGIVQKLPDSAGGHIHTAVATGSWTPVPMGGISVEAYLDSVGGTATVEVHGSNINGATPSAGTLMLTFTLSGANDRGVQSKPDAKTFYMCAKVTAIGGGARAQVAIGGLI